MQKLIISTIIGVVIGILLGASIVAPRLSAPIKDMALGNEIPTAKDHEIVEAAEVLHVEAKVIANSESLLNGDGVRWKMASAFDVGMPIVGDMAQKVVSDIDILSGGEITIKYHAPDTISPTKEMFQAVSSGAIDAAFTTPLMDMAHDRSLGLFGAHPFGPEPDELLAWFYAGGGQKDFEDIYHNLGMHAEVCGLISGQPAGWFQKEMKTPEDFKGLKFNIGGFAASTVEKLGALTVQLKPNKIYQALIDDGIHAASFSMPSVDYSLKLHKAAQYYYFPGWHQRATLLTLLVRHDTWKALSPQHQMQIKTVCGDNTRYGMAIGEAGQFEALKAFSAHGIEISEFPTEILDTLNNTWLDVVQEESAANKDFRRIWKSLSLFRRDYDIWNDLNSM